MSGEIENPRSPVAPDSTIRYGEHPDQVVDLYLPPNQSGRTVVFIHGGFWRPRWDRDHARDTASALAELGYVCALPEYRRTPGRPDDSIDDVCASVGALGVDAPIVIGHSAGGHLALLTALRRPVAGAIALAPVADLRHADLLNLGDGAVRDYLGADPVERPELDPSQCVAPSTPVVIVHGELDVDVPISVSEHLVESWGSACRLVVPAETDHMDVIVPGTRAWFAVVAELNALAMR